MARYNSTLNAMDITGVLRQDDQAPTKYECEGLMLRSPNARDSVATMNENPSSPVVQEPRCLPYIHEEGPQRIEDPYDDFGLRFNSIDSITTTLEDFRTLESFVREVIDFKEGATELFGEGRYKEASDEFKRILDTMQDLYHQFRDNEEFLSTATNVLQIYKEAHLNYALCLIKLGEFEHAGDILTSLIHYDSNCCKGRYLRGKCYLLTGHFEKAMQDFTMAKDLKPSYFELIDRYL